MTSLQQRRDAQTRAELSTAAIALFSADGFAETTMEDVASAAGVSRRTVYRHYSAKEDLIFEHPRQWLEVFRSAAHESAEDETRRETCERGVLAVATAIEASRDDVLPAFGVVIATPELRNSYGRMNRNWLEEYTGFLTDDSRPADADAVLRTSVVAGALVGGTDRALAHWFLHPDTSLIELTAQALEMIGPLWPTT